MYSLFMGPGAHNAAAYLISPDDLPPSEGEGATLEDGMRRGYRTEL